VFNVEVTSHLQAACEQLRLVTLVVQAQQRCDPGFSAISAHYQSG
jgi:hypothetical protein